MLQQIKEKIESALPGSTIQVVDESEGHLEHNPTGAHIAVNVTYSGFEGKSLVEQHKMIYDILREELKEQVHALKIRTRTQ